MDQVPGSAITDHFATLTDPRVERTREHQLLDWSCPGFVALPRSW